MPTFPFRYERPEQNITPSYDAITYRYGSTYFAEDASGANLIYPSTNPTTILNAASDYIERLGGGMLVVRGNYTLNTEWAIKASHIMIRGSRATITASSSFATGSGTQLIHVGDGSSTYSDIDIAGLNIDANSKPNFGIRLHADNGSITNASIDKCLFTGAVLNGLSNETCTYTKVTQCHFKSNNTGYYGESVSRGSLVACTFQDNTSKAISLNAADISIMGCSIGAQHGSEVGISSNEAQRCKIIGNEFKDLDIAITSSKELATSTPNRGLIILGNNFWECEKGIELHRDHRDCVIKSNTMFDVKNGIELNTFGDTGFQDNCCQGNTMYGTNEAGGIGVWINAASANRYDSNFITNFETLESFTNSPTFMERAGTAKIDSGSTSKTVTHLLSYTPNASDISITLGENSTNDPGIIWVDTCTSTDFNVNCRADPGASHLDFGWHARKRGNAS